MQALAIAVVLWYAGRSVYVTASMVLSVRHCAAAAAAVAAEPAPDTAGPATGALRPSTPSLAVLLPVLREQAVLPRLMGNFAVLAEDWPRLSVVVATSAKEDADGPHVPGVPSTDALARDLARQLNDSLGRTVFHVVRYPHTDGRRASQLNHAVRELPALLGTESAPDYIAVYDADALPDARLRDQVAHAALTRPAMIQQLQLPALLSAAAPRRGPVLAGQELFAFRRVFGIEYRRILIGAWCNGRRAWHPLRLLLRPMVYGIGSGLLIRTDAVPEMGYFQEPHDDLAVGHRFSLAGAEIRVLPSVNVTEPYLSLSAMARAFSSVAFGNAATVRDYRFARERRSTLRPAEQAMLLVRALADGVLWASGPLICLAALVWCAVTSAVPAWLLAVAAVLGGVVEPVIAWVLRNRVVREFREPGAPSRPRAQAGPARSIVTYLLQPAFAASGPWLLLARVCAARLARREIAFTKTEHVGEN